VTPIQPAPDAVWPATVTGWVTLLGLLAGLLGSIIAFSKFLGKLNGLGDRVNACEKTEERHSERIIALERLMDRSIDDRANLHRETGEARHAAEECNEGNIVLKADIVGAINDMRHAMTNELGQLRERIKAVEVELQLRKPGTGHRG